MGNGHDVLYAIIIIVVYVSLTLSALNRKDKESYLSEEDKNHYHHYRKTEKHIKEE